MSFLQAAYQGVTTISEGIFRKILSARAEAGKENPDRLPERMGLSSRPRPPGTLVWIHGASVGETQSALVIIDRLLATDPGLHILMTSGTLTSARLLEKRLPKGAFHQFLPLDHPRWTASFLDHWRPDLAIWLESELWPNIIAGVKTRNIPAILVNARMSEKSFNTWRLAKGFARSLLSAFTQILAQTERDRAAFESLGAKNVAVCGNIKYGAAPLPFDEMAFTALDLSAAGRPMWVYASTHDGEEALACRMHARLKASHPDLLTIIVPRHPDRRAAIAATCAENGLPYRLRGGNFTLPAAADYLYIADTMGELGLFYKLCPVAMIGRSFSHDGGGGHNPIEAAQYGCAVLSGPHNQFQEQLYKDMADEDAVLRVSTEDSLFDALSRLLSDNVYLAERRQKARDFTLKKQDIVDRVMAEILPMLQRTEPPRAHAPENT